MILKNDDDFSSESLPNIISTRSNNTTLFSKFTLLSSKKPKTLKSISQPVNNISQKSTPLGLISCNFVSPIVYSKEGIEESSTQPQVIDSSSLRLNLLPKNLEDNLKSGR